MEWKTEPNKKTLLIIRRSGYGQKENTSGDTQSREGRDYAVRHGLDIVHEESIIETAFKRKERRKFRALIQKALSENIRHVLFFWSSREARNLTDLEENDDLIRSGKIIIHHVSEGKVYWKGTPDSDFTYRELNAVINKSESRSKSTMLKASLRTKALAGWWPYRHTTLGYVHHKDRDKFNNPIKGTAKVGLDPDFRKVRLAQREFELRAKGFSYDEIRRQNLEEKNLVPDEMRKTYSRHAIEVRLKNEFYWGFFSLTGDSKRYEGKHEKIIPAKILKAVEAVNAGNACKLRTSVAVGDDIFRGWLKCNHPECQRLITYEKKRKTLKSTGEAKVYHLYRCSNSRKIHDKHVYVSEEKVWAQFEPSVDRFDITDAFAADILKAMEESFDVDQRTHKRQLDGQRGALKDLERKEDKLYADYADGVLDKDGHQRQLRRIRDERDALNRQFEDLTLLISDSSKTAVRKMFELATDAKTLWKSMNREERVGFLKKVCSNPTLDELTLHYHLQKPFARIASMKQNSMWRRGRDLNP